jgi:hypothetical protein
MTQLELPFDDDLAPEASSPGYFTIAEAAKIMRCHERAIHRAIDVKSQLEGFTRCSPTPVTCVVAVFAV